LKRQHHSREQPREEHDAQRLHSNLVHLLHQILRVERPREDEAQRFPGEREVLLDGQDLPFRRFVDPSEEVGQACGVM
jgi:hypothetical protein